MKNETWGSKLLLILAVAGGAIGIGNFLRFPTLFAQYGGWFLVPYFASFFLLGLPLMLIEWTIGAYSRDEERHSLSTFLEKRFPNYRFVKYLGIISVACCLIIAGYYIYIESWMLGYSILSLKGVFNNIPANELGDFLGSYIGFKGGVEVAVITIISLVIAVFLNFFFVAKGISKGISVVIKWSMPILLIMSLLMLVRVFCQPNIFDGIKYMFRGDISQLFNLKMWVAAASQMFFSLSVGFTSTMVYVTYSKNNIDILKDGATSAFMNMGIEVLIASFMTIPVSFLVFGEKMDQVAHSSSIAFGMVSMPSIFQDIPGASVWCFLWFFLLFIAAVTSSISMVQVFQSYLCDKLDISKVKSSLLNLCVFILVIIPTVVVPCGIDEFDFWTNTVLMPIGALILVCIVHGLKDSYSEKYKENTKHRTSGVGKFITKYITPLYLIIIIVPFIVNTVRDMFAGKDLNWEHYLCRGVIIVVFLIYGLTLHHKKNKK